MTATPSHNPDVSSGTATESYLRAIIESQPVCLIRVAADGTLYAANEAARTMLGCESPDEVIGQRLSRFVAEDQQKMFYGFVDRVASGARESLEVSLTNLQQAVSIVELRGVPIANAPDGVPSALVVCRDMSEHRRLEQSLMDSVTRLDARGQ